MAIDPLDPKYIAHTMVAEAIRTGALIRPDLCPECGKKPRWSVVNAHHHNGYTNGHELDIVWLCGDCHKKLHPNKKGKKERKPVEKQIPVQDTTNSGSRWVRGKEVAERFSVSEKTLRVWCMRGLVNFLKLPSGHRRYCVEDIERLLEKKAEELK